MIKAVIVCEKNDSVTKVWTGVGYLLSSTSVFQVYDVLFVFNLVSFLFKVFNLVLQFTCLMLYSRVTSFLS